MIQNKLYITSIFVFVFLNNIFVQIFAQTTKPLVIKATFLNALPQRIYLEKPVNGKSFLIDSADITPKNNKIILKAGSPNPDIKEFYFLHTQTSGYYPILFNNEDIEFCLNMDFKTKFKSYCDGYLTIKGSEITIEHYKLKCEARELELLKKNINLQIDSLIKNNADISVINNNKQMLARTDTLIFNIYYNQLKTLRYERNFGIPFLAIQEYRMLKPYDPLFDFLFLKYKGNAEIEKNINLLNRIAKTTNK